MILNKFLFMCIYILIIGVNILRAEAYTNRLINEKSPYLLQHAHNPVDWYSWTEEAFNKAKKENKPIFLSIGYSTCHWCHVMEKESFSDEKIAKILNDNFVPIKVDREERPDIDNYYMQAVMAMTGRGGWPLNVFLTPDKKPFFGGTYFPPEDKWGMRSFKNVLETISRSWKEQQEEIINSSQMLAAVMNNKTYAQDSKQEKLNHRSLEQAYEQFKLRFDSRFGGFQGAPKFPMPQSYAFLLRFAQLNQEEKAKDIVKKTLLEMGKGGIYDQLGGGFHRYSTDEQWRIPHFEKMLYDQALISKLYLETYQQTKDERFAQIAREILDYVIHDMSNTEGGFYSAEDADAPALTKKGEKEEGAFYLWRYDEVIDLLGKQKGEIFCYYFGVQKNGNALSDVHGLFKGKNVLYQAHTFEDTAKHFHKEINFIEKVIAESKNRLFKNRAKRPRPHLDDKILLDWNSLMISSLALAARVLDDKRYEEYAERTTRFIFNNMVDKQGMLLHRYREKEAAIGGMIDDYAFFIQALLDLYKATFEFEYLREAKNFSEKILELFWDQDKGGFFFSPKTQNTIFSKQKEIFDGVIPSGNAIAALDLLRLGKITSEKKFINKAEALLKTFYSDINKSPQSFPQMLNALAFLVYPTREVVIVGDEDEIHPVLKILNSKFIPQTVLIFKPQDEKKAKDIVREIPFLKHYDKIQGKITVYICKDYACQEPITDLLKLKKLWQEK